MNYGNVDIAEDVKSREAGMANRSKSKPTPRQAAAMLISLNETIRARNEALETENLRLQRSLEEKTKMIAEMELELKLAVMHLAGMEAELKAMRDQHNYSSLLEESGETLPDGSAKTYARLIYEEAFDREGRAQGISNPEEYRIPIPEEDI